MKNLNDPAKKRGRKFVAKFYDTVYCVEIIVRTILLCYCQFTSFIRAQVMCERSDLSHVPILNNAGKWHYELLLQK